MATPSPTSTRSMRRSSLPLVCALAALVACRSASNGPPVMDAAQLFEGRADAGTITDTTDEKSTISLVERAKWSLRTRPNPRSDFWSDVALLDIESADVAAKSMDQKTFAVALRTLMSGDPD